MSSVEVINHISEWIDRCHRLTLFIIDLFDWFTVIEKFFVAKVFVSNLENLELICCLHSHLFAYHHFEIFDFRLVDWH